MGLKSQVTGRLKQAAGSLLGSESFRREGEQEERAGATKDHERARDERARAEKAEADARFEERRAEREEESEEALRRARSGE